jgi:adenine-specific DNA methylase
MPGEKGRGFRLPTKRDLEIVTEATELLRKRSLEHAEGISVIPQEPLPVMSGVFNAPLYGHNTWGSLYTDRQMLVMTTLAKHVRELANTIDASVPVHTKLAIQTCLAMAVDRQADHGNCGCTWNPSGPKLQHLFGRQAIPMNWDFAEANPFGDSVGDWMHAVECVQIALTNAASCTGSATVVQANAAEHPLPDDSATAFVTDPPYYNAVPYADLSDFLYVWLRRTVGSLYPALFRDELSPKSDELCEMAGWDPARYAHKTASWFEQGMSAAMSEGRRYLTPSGIGVVVFAHKTTEGWEAMLAAMIEAGWVVTASWPIDTEMATRLRAMGSSALASSIHLVCRPRENVDGSLRKDEVGDWRTVLAELPVRIRHWMPRLAEEGVVGADAIFACLGPALEIFSRYSRVEKASGEVVTLREYLEQVWAAVSTEALSMIFRDADAAGLESDARFTAIVLWTLGAGGTASTEASESDSEDDEEDDEDEAPKGKAAKGGFTLEYDAARKIAQGLGVNLEQIDSVVEVKGDKARLRPVSERAASLFGKTEKTEAATKKRGRMATQKKLFDKDAEEGGNTADTVTIGEGAAATPGVTALDRVHQAMLLFASGRADALKRFIVEDGVGGDARFWKLAQSLSALYPAGSDEKRWVDGVLTRKKSFGF